MPSIVSKIVEVYVFRVVDGDPEYLVLKRANDEPLYPGLWQIVTGTLENGETAVRGAMREVGEETGLTITRLWSVPGLGGFFDAAADAVNLCPLFAAEVAGGREPKLSAEHQMYGWFNHERARSHLVWPSQRQTLDLVHEFIASGAESSHLTQIVLSSFERDVP
jgi:dihydroneopterin triphosphate diphosphatase